jgi:hypothetical protein
MRFIQRFDICRRSVWLCLLVVALLISAPLYASHAVVSSVGGEITAIDVIGRVIEIGGTRYTLASQAEIHRASSETPKALSIDDLKAGQYVEFEVSGTIIQSLRVFEQGRPR